MNGGSVTPFSTQIRARKACEFCVKGFILFDNSFFLIVYIVCIIIFATFIITCICHSNYDHRWCCFRRSEITRTRKTNKQKKNAHSEARLAICALCSGVDESAAMQAWRSNLHESRWLLLALCS